jgi:hypothetical protein
MDIGRQGGYYIKNKNGLFLLIMSLSLVFTLRQVALGMLKDPKIKKWLLG